MQMALALANSVGKEWLTPCDAPGYDSLEEGRLLARCAVPFPDPPGKTSPLKILAGELRAQRGQIVRRGAQGYCPQQVVLHDGLTVNQHLDYFRAAYGLRDLRRADELIERLGYSTYRTSLVKTLSGVPNRN